jgi:hypothetical protein
VWVDSGPLRQIPNTRGGVAGREAAPNRRGAEWAGLVAGPNAVDAEATSSRRAPTSCAALFVADSDFGKAARDPKVVERLRKARFLAVMGWADTPLARAADVVCRSPRTPSARAPSSTRRAAAALRARLPGAGQARPAVEALAELLARFDRQVGRGQCRDRLRSDGRGGRSLRRPALERHSAPGRLARRGREEEGAA